MNEAGVPRNRAELIDPRRLGEAATSGRKQGNPSQLVGIMEIDALGSL
jgi:hypothetical protein